MNELTTKKITDVNNWFFSTIDAYKPPEVGIILCGDVKEDGEVRKIKTSVIVESVGRMVITRSGSHYKLLEPKQDYVDWCLKNGYKDPRKDENAAEILKSNCTSSNGVSPHTPKHVKEKPND